jgi:hypothetical protein
VPGHVAGHRRPPIRVAESARPRRGGVRPRRGAPLQNGRPALFSGMGS